MDQEDDDTSRDTGLRGILLTLWHEIPSDHMSTVAAGLAYYGVFGLLPALAAAAALLGQFGGFDALAESAQDDRGVLPQGTRLLFREFLTGVPQGLGSGAWLALNIGIVLFTAQRAANGLLTSLNIVYDVEEKRGRLRRMALALGVGAIGIALLFTALAIVVLPHVLAPDAPASPCGAGQCWPSASALSLAALFRFGPCRDGARWRAVAIGASVATVLWVLVSAGLSFYVAHLGSFRKFYGSLGSFAVILMWFYGGGFAVLAGAEIDSVLTAAAERPAEIEHARQAPPPRPGRRRRRIAAGASVRLAQRPIHLGQMRAHRQVHAAASRQSFGEPPIVQRAQPARLRQPLEALPHQRRKVRIVVPQRDRIRLIGQDSRRRCGSVAHQPASPAARPAECRRTRTHPLGRPRASRRPPSTSGVSVTRGGGVSRGAPARFITAAFVVPALTASVLPARS